MKSLVVALVVAVSATTTLPCAGAVPGHSAPSGVQVVTIEVDGDEAALGRTRAVAGELLTRLGVASMVTSSADDARGKLPGTVLARAYFDLRVATQPRLVIVDGQSEREVVRRELPESTSLEVSVEELSHVLYAIVEALISEGPPEALPAQRPARAAKPAARPAPARTPQRVQRSQAQVEAGAFFRVLDLGSSVVPGGGASLTARATQGRVAPGAMLMAAAHGSTAVTYDTAVAGVRPFSLRLYPTLSVATSSSVLLVAGLGGGIDWFRVERERTPAQALPGVSSVLDVTLGGFVGARFQVSRDIALDAAASLDLDLKPHHFVVESDSGRSTLLELSRLRPAALFGASYSLGSTGPTSRQGASP